MEIMIRLYLALTGILDRVAAAAAPQPQLALARSRRGAGFLEYMMLAALAVLIAGAIKLVLPDAVDGLLARVKAALQ